MEEPLSLSDASWFSGELHMLQEAEENFDIWQYDAGCHPAPQNAAVMLGRVSVVTPTTESRQGFHERLWTCFQEQTYPDKELVIVETYENRCSSVFTERAMRDHRVVYERYKRPKGGDWTIGAKRNIGSSLASGEFIVHFDDDDLYAPSYVTTLVDEIQKAEARQYERVLGITLSTWYMLDVETQRFGYCAPKETREVYGYGFSYMYRREAALEIPFRDMNLGEDFIFFSELRKRYGDNCIALFEDTDGICLHVLHEHSTSNVNALVEVEPQDAMDLYFAEYQSFLSLSLQEHTGRSRASWDGIFLRTREQRFRNVLTHICFGDFTFNCPRGATGQTFIKVVEENIGALPHETKLLRLVDNAKIQVLESERIGAYTTEVWLEMPSTEEHPDNDLVQSLGLLFPSMHSRKIVHVTCPSSLRSGSVCRIFHVDLPADARVEQLREILEPYGLPKSGQIFAQLPEHRRAALRDHDFLPHRVLLSKWSGIVTISMVLTLSQAQQWQQMLKAFLQLPETQERLDEFERTAGGHFSKYWRLLRHMMNFEVFPKWMHHFGLPNDDKGPILLYQAVGAHMTEDFVEGAEETLRIQRLQRDQMGIPGSEMWVEQAKAYVERRNRGEFTKVWLVSGGGSPNGIVVREGKDFKSPELARLGIGAVVKEVELIGNRMYYEKLIGTGPDRGWVSLEVTERLEANGNKLERKKKLLTCKNLWKAPSSSSLEGIFVDVQGLSDARLSKDALVVDIEIRKSRMHFQKVYGDGPDVGWVNFVLPNGKKLLKCI